MVSTFFDPTTSNLQGLKRSQVEGLVEKKHHDCGAAWRAVGFLHLGMNKLWMITLWLFNIAMENHHF
jgi:hypothetical protein